LIEKYNPERRVVDHRVADDFDCALVRSNVLSHQYAKASINR